MNKKLQNKLFKKYPKIFRQKDLSCQETCMCWGICTGDGWYWLIDMLCGCIQSYLDNNAKHLDLEQIEAIQVKEKFGSLRFYTNYYNETVDGFIWLAGYLSVHICEECGSMEDVTQTKGWIKTLCKKCLNFN